MNALDRAVSRLEQVIARTPGRRLPPATALAAELGAGRGTVLAAARVLRDRGILDFDRGRPIGIRGRRTAGEVVHRYRPEERVARHLRERIESGELRTGRRLPTAAALAARLHTSLSAVGAAMRLLARDRLVHKRGRAWVAGPTPIPPVKRRRRNPASSPAIVLLLDRPDTWFDVLESERTRAFAIQLDQEARRFGVSVLHAFTDTARAPSWARCIGPEAVRRLIRRLGKRYVGCLVPGDPGRIGGLAQWAERLRDYERPLVWLDVDGAAEPDALIDPLLVRCRLDQRAAAELALRYLARRGHREVLYLWRPGRGGEDGQQHHCGRAIESVAPTLGMTVRKLESHDPAEPSDTHTPVRFPRRLGATALIVPDDHGLPAILQPPVRGATLLPKRLSLISFGNGRESRGLGVTSVDLGFDYLGYAAFHTLLGVIDVRRAIDGTIAAKPSVADRGSVLRARGR